MSLSFLSCASLWVVYCWDMKTTRTAAITLSLTLNRSTVAGDEYRVTASYGSRSCEVMVIDDLVGAWIVCERTLNPSIPRRVRKHIIGAAESGELERLLARAA